MPLSCHQSSEVASDDSSSFPYIDEDIVQLKSRSNERLMGQSKSRLKLVFKLANF